MMSSLQDKGVLLPEQGKEVRSYNNHSQMSILEIRWIKGLYQEIKKRLQEYTEELYKKDLQDPDSHDGVIT